MSDKKKLNLRSIDISAKEKFQAHPIRFICTLPLYAALIYAVCYLITYPSLGMLIFIIIVGFILTFLEWIIYGPINIRTLKQEKQMEAMAEYLAADRMNNGTETKNEAQTYRKFCQQCGKAVEKEWTICPFCETVLKDSKTREVK